MAAPQDRVLDHLLCRGSRRARCGSDRIDSDQTLEPSNLERAASRRAKQSLATNKGQPLSFCTLRYFGKKMKNATKMLRELKLLSTTTATGHLPSSQSSRGAINRFTVRSAWPRFRAWGDEPPQLLAATQRSALLR